MTDGVKETDHTRGIEENGDMTMDDRGGEPNVGSMNKVLLSKIWTHKI